MESALTGNQAETRRLTTNADDLPCTHELFRSKVRLIASIVGGGTTRAEGCNLSVDAVPMGVEQSHGSLPPQEQAEHTTRATALELYARFNATGDGLDRGQVDAALKSNGILESDIFIDAAFAKCDACAIGRLEQESFVKLCSIVYARKERREKSAGSLVKEAQHRAPAQALAMPGYVMPRRESTPTSFAD